MKNNDNTVWACSRRYMDNGYSQKREWPSGKELSEDCGGWILELGFKG